MKSEEIFAKGYAIRVFNLNNELVDYHYRGEVIRLEKALPMETLPGCPYQLAKIEDIRRADGRLLRLLAEGDVC